MVKGKTKKTLERAREAVLLLDKRRKQTYVVERLYGKATDSNRNNFRRDILRPLLCDFVGETFMFPELPLSGRKRTSYRKKFRREEKKYEEFLRKEKELSEYLRHKKSKLRKKLKLRKEAVDLLKDLKISKIAGYYGMRSKFRKGRDKILFIHPKKLMSIWLKEQKKLVKDVLDSTKKRRIPFFSMEKDRKETSKQMKELHKTVKKDRRKEERQMNKIHKTIKTLTKNRFMFAHLKLFFLGCIKLGYPLDKITEILGKDYAYAIAQRINKLEKIKTDRKDIGKEYLDFIKHLEEYADFISLTEVEPKSIKAMDFSLDSNPYFYDEWDFYYSSKK